MRDGKRDWLWVRFLHEYLKYLIFFSTALYSANQYVKVEKLDICIYLISLLYMRSARLRPKTTELFTLYTELRLKFVMCDLLKS